ncbi:MAG: cupin domain-containing protein [Anaerolineae bacterium]|nr:cupin domain-containing protein [Anaerolineae bacterium]
MNDRFEPDVGLRLRTLREKQGWSLRELAEQCGLSFNAISRIERGENSPTVSTLHSLATALNIPMTAFFEDAREQTLVQVKRDERLSSTADGIAMESLGIGLRDQQMEPFVVTVQPGAGNGDSPIVHSGEEFIHCLEGSIIYRVNADDYTLDSGDSLLFEATQPHCFYNPGEKPARLLMVFQASHGGYAIGPRHLEG